MMTGHVWIFLVLLVIIGAVIAGVFLLATAIGRPVGRGAASSSRDRRECPACKEWMRREASICPHCRSPSEPWTLHDGRWWVVRPDGSYFLDEGTGAWRPFVPPSPPP